MCGANRRHGRRGVGDRNPAANAPRVNITLLVFVSSKHFELVVASLFEHESSQNARIYYTCKNLLTVFLRAPEKINRDWRTIRNIIAQVGRNNNNSDNNNSQPKWPTSK